MAINSKILSDEQREFVKTQLSISAKLLKKYTDLVSRNDRVQFRESILSKSPDYSKIEEKYIEMLKDDMQIILAPKTIKHSCLDNRTIEMALIEGYYYLFAKWCKGNEDLLQDYIVKVLNSVYLFTKPEKSLVQYLKRTFHRFRSNHGRNKLQQLITTPERWNLLRVSFENERIQNPYLSSNEVMDLMKLNKKQRTNLIQQMQVTNISRIDIECNNETNDPVAKKYQEIQTIDINSAPLTKLQKDCIIAYMHDDWGWQTRMAEKSINPKTNQPYSKMAITNNLREALVILRDHVEKNIE